MAGKLVREEQILAPWGVGSRRRFRHSDHFGAIALGVDSPGIYEEVRDSIVCIQYQNRECYGSGLYIDEEGILVTALHVVEFLEQYDWLEIWIGCREAPPPKQMPHADRR